MEGFHINNTSLHIILVQFILQFIAYSANWYTVFLQEACQILVFSEKDYVFHPTEIPD
jgi:hypothetical protein